MSCRDTGALAWGKGRANQANFTYYEDAAQTTPEDLTGREFVMVVFNTETPATVYETLQNPTNGGAAGTLDFTSVAATDWSAAGESVSFEVVDVTDENEPLTMHTGFIDLKEMPPLD